MVINILDQTRANEYFRRVVHTGEKSQLVVMCIAPGDDIGAEVHPHVEQIIFNLSGTAKAIIDGTEQQFSPGDVLIIKPGTKHDVVNTGKEYLKLYTIYVPANHIDGTIHQTKQDAIKDTKDEAFGEAI